MDFVKWSEFDFERLPQTSATFRRDHKYSNFIASFDCETTNYKNLFSFMYIWQFAIEDQVAYGRTWEELREFLADIKEHLHLSFGHKLIVFDHYLKYDFGFFKREVPIDGKLIAKSKTEIVLCTVFDCFEFRDSWNYTEKPLEEMGEEVGLHKLKGFDYSKIRHAGTDLMNSELAYCCRDCEILQLYYSQQADIFGSVGKIPLTCTLRVKKYMADKMRASDKTGIMLAMIRKRQLDPDKPEDRKTLKHLRLAFFGGFNYCTTMYKGQIMPGCDHYDANSHYIAQILLHKFPKNRFEPLPVPASPLELIEHTGIYKNKAMLITFSFQGLEAAQKDVAFLPVYNKNYIEADLADRKTMVTHKRTYIEKGIMTLTDVDFFLLSKYYKARKIAILEVIGSDYGVLPDYVTDTCIDLYIKKSAAKAELKKIKETREPTPEENAGYNLIKSYLNRIYGMFVQDPVRSNYCFIDGRVEIDKAEQITTQKTLYSPVLYQWGVWVAAWARFELLRLFGVLCLDKQSDGSKRYNYRILYCDTDSLIGYDLDTNIIAQYNANVKARVRDLCRRKKIPFELLDGLGEFEGERWDYFKTIGQKQYAYITTKGEFIYHISGLAQPKADESGKLHSYFDKFDTLYEKISALDQDMIVEPEESGLLKSIFGGERDPETITDYQGHKAQVKVRSYVLLIPRGFKLHLELEEKIREADPERVKKMHAKAGHFCGVIA